MLAASALGSVRIIIFKCNTQHNQPDVGGLSSRYKVLKRNPHKLNGYFHITRQ